jgi:hypothetical protein
MQRELCERIAHTLATAPIHDHLGYEALAYLKLPGPNYLQVLRALHMTLWPKLYVEIGVREGKSLELAHANTRCIAIDPAPSQALVEKGKPNTAFSVSTSDAFFANPHNSQLVAGFDLAFIDGDHSFDHALRDFESLERLAKPSSIIAIHDVIPMDERTATPLPQSSFHTGDVWRLMAAIVERTDLVAFTVACPPTGLGIVGNFRSPLGVMYSAAHMPFQSDWDEQMKLLNIIPNTPQAFLQAINGATRK